jgi:hypothetical protein
MNSHITNIFPPLSIKVISMGRTMATATAAVMVTLMAMVTPTATAMTATMATAMAMIRMECIHKK